MPQPKYCGVLKFPDEPPNPLLFNSASFRSSGYADSLCQKNSSNNNNNNKTQINKQKKKNTDFHCLCSFVKLRDLSKHAGHYLGILGLYIPTR